MKTSVFSALLLGLGAIAWGSPDFEAGNRAYDEGKFLEARQHYQAQVGRGEWTANLFYNLGNADQRVGALGLAMLNYERALVLRPGHPQARANLRLLREQAQAKVAPATWLSRTWSLLSFNAWLGLASVAGWLAVFLLVLPFLRGRRLTAPGVTGAVLAGCLAAAAGFGASRAAGELDAAVVIVQEVEARQAPMEVAALAEALPVGSRVRIFKVLGDWTQCALPDGTTGWIPSKAIERIHLQT